MTETEPDKRILTLHQAVVTGRLDKALSVLEEISGTSGPDAVALTEQAGAVLCRLYSSFHGTTVEQIFGALSGVAAGPLARIRLTLQSDVETTMSWRRRLSGLSNERLANSLVDAMKMVMDC